MTDPLSPAELQLARSEHVPCMCGGSHFVIHGVPVEHCGTTTFHGPSRWPCEPARLLATISELEAAWEIEHETLRRFVQERDNLLARVAELTAALDDVVIDVKANHDHRCTDELISGATYEKVRAAMEGQR